jgi:hypothetical protein
MLQRALGWAFLPLCGAILLAAGAAGQIVGADQKSLPRAFDAQQILSWLPPDTETVIVARDFTRPDPAVLEKTKIYTQELAFSELALSSTLAKISSSAVARRPEHRVALDDLLGALEHELHAPEVAERRPATLGV